MIFQLSIDHVFPLSYLAEPDGLLAVGGDLSKDRLLLAYSLGIFPWYDDPEGPILWWSPHERAVIEPTSIHVGRTLQRFLKKNSFEVRFDTQFAQVITSCADAKRKSQDGTWIVPDMQEAYIRLYNEGFAHSVEVYLQGVLVGGLYGVSLGGVFFGESMFSKVPNASKVAFLHLGSLLSEWGFHLIDCQMMNKYLASFGVYSIPREKYLQRLEDALLMPTRQGFWNNSCLVQKNDYTRRSKE